MRLQVAVNRRLTFFKEVKRARAKAGGAHPGIASALAQEKGAAKRRSERGERSGALRNGAQPWPS